MILNSGIIDVCDYPVYTGEEVPQVLNEFLRKKISSGANIFFLCDENTSTLCLPKLIGRNLPEEYFSYVMHAGEDRKNLEEARIIWEWLISRKADKDSLLVNLGGGVVSDLGGFVAAAFKRGIPYINVPTTLLGMVDASIGAKVGLNLGDLKNQIGFFYPPEAVFVWPEFLKTLDPKHIRSGLAEMAKHALLDGEKSWNSFRKIEKDRDIPAKLIFQSIRIKCKYAAADPRDKNIRQALNLGHSIGHALESFSLRPGNKNLSHGEAVAAGLICESWISLKLTSLSPVIYEQVRQFVVENFGTYPLNKKDLELVLNFIEFDKKNSGGKIILSLLQSVGQPIIKQAVSREMLIEALNTYRKI